MFKTNKTPKAIASLLIILQCLIFGMGFIAVKKLLDFRFPVFLLLFIRFSIGALFLLCIGLFFRSSKKINLLIGSISRFYSKDVYGGVVSGLILFFAFTFQTLGASITTPAKNGLLTDLFVVIVPIISSIQLRKFKVKQIVSALLAFIGVAIVMNIFANDNTMNWGDGLSIICSFLFATQFIILDKYAKTEKNGTKMNPYNFTVAQLTSIAVSSILISLLFEIKEYAFINWSDSVKWLLFLGICASAIAYLFQFFAQKVISADSVTLLSCSETIFTVVFSLIFGYEKVTLQLGIGSSVIIIAIWLSSINFNFEKIRNKY